MAASQSIFEGKGVVMETQDSIVLSELENYETEGRGDCAFHATCGEWDRIKRRIICQNVGDLRKSVSEKIRACRQGDAIYPAVREAIFEMLISGDIHERKNFDILKKDYHCYLYSNKDAVAKAWKNFELSLNGYQDVLAHIKNEIPENKRTLSLQEQFSHLLSEDDGTLYAIIFSIPTLFKKFTVYHEETNKDFDLDSFLKNQALLDEYAALVSKYSDTSGGGYWLLPGELDIVARVLEITINLYITDQVTHKTKHIETYNLKETPGSSVVNIYFNGRNHYERMAPKGTYSSKFDSSSSYNNPIVLTTTFNRGNYKICTSTLATHKPILESEDEHSSSGLKKSLHGDVYQLKLLMLFLKRGIQNSYNFRLATEMDDAEKFDDVFFKYVREGETYYRCLQAKHKHEDKSKISDADLLAEENGEFSLRKYFSSFQKVKKKLVDGRLQELTICTNIGFDFDGDKKPGRVIKLRDALEKLVKPDDILNVSGKKTATRYRFKGSESFHGKKELYEALRSAELNNIADTLAECVIKKKSLSLHASIFKIYHLALTKEVLDIKNKKFQDQFISGKPAGSQVAQGFRKIFFEKIAHHKKLSKDSSKYEPEVMKFLIEISLDISSTFGKATTEGSIENLPEETEIKDENIDEFLQYLVFAVDQPTEVELGNLITKELGEDFNLINSSFIASYFQEKMLDWMKRKKGTFLSTKQGRAFFSHLEQMVDQLILIGPTLEYCEILKHSKIGFKQPFDLSAFLNSKIRVLNYLSPNATWLSSIKIYQALELSKDYKKQGSYIFITLDSCINLFSRLISAFKADAGILIIECNVVIDSNVFKDFISHLLDTLKDFGSKKIIIISKEKSSLFSLFDEEIVVGSESDQDSSFSDLTDASRKVLQTKEITLQGNMTTLSKLLPAEDLGQVLQSMAFLEFVSSTNIVIDSAPVMMSEFEKSCYIPRMLQRKVTIKKECLLENISDVFALSNITDESELKKLIKSSETIRRFNQADTISEHPCRYVVMEDGEAEAQFQELLSKFSGSNVHWLKKEAEDFSWKMSRGSLQGLRKFVVDDSYEETKAGLVQEKIVIISAEPGMGKSTTIDFLSENEKKEHPSRWVIKIDLKAQKELIESMNINNIKDVISFFSEVLKLSYLGQSLLECFLQKLEERVVLYLDGFDEICSEHQIKIVQLMQILKRLSKIEKIVVATRQHMQNNLEDGLGVFSYGLKSFSEEDQLAYLKRFWESHLELTIDSDEAVEKFKNFAVQLRMLFSASIKDNQYNFMGIPLQARLLAEAFQTVFREYYLSDEDVVFLPDSLDIVDLYQRFIDQKYQIYLVHKEQIDRNLNIAHRDLILKALTKDHQRLAFYVLFEPYLRDFFSENKQKFSDMDLNSVGIVQHIENRVSFVHRTFSEYFVATFFLSLLKKSSDHPSCFKVIEFLKEHIFRARNGVVKVILENLISKDGEKNIKDSWKEVCESFIAAVPSEGKNRGRLWIAEYIDEKDSLSDRDENPVEKFDKDLDGLEKFRGWVKIDEISKFFPSFFKNIVKVKDIKRLEMALEKLAEIGKNTDLNKLKGEILKNVDLLIKHYLSQVFASLDDDSKFQLELLENFCKIVPNYNTRDFGQYVAASVSVELERWKEMLSGYRKLLKLNIKDLEKDAFLDNLKLEKILFLRIENYIFSHEGLKSLMQAYPEWKNDVHYGKIFRELFLQIDVNEAEEVKQFFIKYQDYHFLVSLRNKFQQLHFTEEEIATIYGYKEHLGNLLWLERAGIELSYGFRQLNLKMVDYFVLPLRENTINGFHTGYAANVYGQLISPLIDILRTTTLSSVRNIDRLALIDMISKFSQFSLEYGVRVSLDSRQLKSVLTWIESVFNHSFLYGDMLLIGLRSVSEIVKSFGLNFIVTKQKLLLLDPINDFSYELNLTHQSHIVPLLRLAMQPFGQELEATLALECNRTIRQMFPLPTAELSLHQFKHCIYKGRKLDVLIETAPKKARRHSLE